jgi:hypothetical protein
MKKSKILILALCATSSVFAKNPDCTGINRWPTSMALVHLSNAGITNDGRVDLKKTKISRLASERIGKDLYHQIHHITFTETSGKIVEVITSNNASNEECSMSGVDVYVVTKQLGGP